MCDARDAVNNTAHTCKAPHPQNATLHIECTVKGVARPEVMPLPLILPLLLPLPLSLSLLRFVPPLPPPRPLHCCPCPDLCPLQVPLWWRAPCRGVDPPCLPQPALCTLAPAGPSVVEGALQEVDPLVQDVIDIEFGL